MEKTSKGIIMQGTTPLLGVKPYEEYPPLDTQQVIEIRGQVAQAISSGIGPEQPASIPTFVIIGLLRLIDAQAAMLHAMRRSMTNAEESNKEESDGSTSDT